MRFDAECWTCEIQETIQAGKSSPSPPPAPDPATVANAQSAANAETARTQAKLNMVNQYTPGGSLVYTPVPGQEDRYQATVSLSPAGQQAFQSQQALTSGLYGLANNQLGKIQTATSQPLDLSGLPKLPTDLGVDNQNVEDALYQKATSRLDPQFAQQKSALDAQLAAQGITQGSDAYDNAQRDFNFAKNDAYQNARDQAVADSANYQSQLFGLNQAARQQGIQEALMQRELPLNEATALESGGQIQMPQFGNTPQESVAPTDVTGAYALSQNAANQAYQARLAQNSAAMGGLFGLGQAGIMAAPFIFARG